MINEPGVDVFKQTGINKKLNNLLNYDNFDKTWQPEKQKSTKRTDVGLDIINEGADDNYDYEGRGFLKPITIEAIKEEAKRILKKSYSIYFSPGKSGKIDEMIEKFAKRKMHALWDEINYMEENNEGDFEDMSNDIYQ